MIFLNKLTKKFVYSSFMFSVGMANAYAGSDVPEDLFALSPAELASIPVTIASGTRQKLIHSAAVTTVITADDIESMGATDLHEVLETVPGMYVSIQAVTNDYVYSMRGISNETGSRVLFMMNGTRFNVPYKGSMMTGMEIPVEAIQQIEVIRGPGSALYGADAFAGVVNIITKKAEDIDGTVLGIRGGNNDTQSIWGQQSGQILGWNIAASLQYAHNNADKDRIIAADQQTKMDQAFSTSASLAPGPMQTQAERWDAHLNAQRKYVDFNFWAFAEVGRGMQAGAGGALDNRGHVDGNSYLSDLNLSSEDFFQDWELKAKLSYLDTVTQSDFFNFPAGAVLPLDANKNYNPISPVLPPVFFPNGMETAVGIAHRIPSVGFTAIYKGLSQHLVQFRAGYRYEEMTTREKRNYGVGVNSPGGALVDLTGTPNTFLADHHRDIWSFVLQDEWQIETDWQLTAGIRYDEYSDFGSTFNPRAALIWDINPQLTTKLLYGQAFRAPSFLEQFQKNSQLFIGNAALRPEKIETTELALDYRPVQNLRTAFNIFYYEIEDSITAFSTATVNRASNQPGIRAYGGEIEWDWRFLSDWRFRGNYAWQQTRDIATKSRANWQPEHLLYSAVAWNFLPNWQLQTQLHWTGHQFINNQGDRAALSDYETVDLTLNGKQLLGFIDVTGSVRNLFDSHGKNPSTRAYQNYLPIPARSFYLEMKVSF